MLTDDYEWTSFGLGGADPRLVRLTEAILTSMQRAGFEPLHGRRMVSDMAAAGVDTRKPPCQMSGAAFAFEYPTSRNAGVPPARMQQSHITLWAEPLYGLPSMLRTEQVDSPRLRASRLHQVGSIEVSPS